MISKSTKAKRRRNQFYYKKVESITVYVIDNRGEEPFYLLSLPISKDCCSHLEARGMREVVSKYRQLLHACWIMQHRQILKKKEHVWF